MRRRSFLHGVGGILASASVAPSCSAQRGLSLVTRHIDIRRFNTALLPRGHGQFIQLTERVRRRYPSKHQCMQMMAFFNQSEGLLVHTLDTSGAITDWEIIPGDELRITGAGPDLPVKLIEVEPTLEAAATAYRRWAWKQPWVTNRLQPREALSFIAVASTPDPERQKQSLTTILNTVLPPAGAWHTQYRRFPFDVGYPDFTPKQPPEFRRLQTWAANRGCVNFPYFNGLLWDRNHFDSHAWSLLDAHSREVRYNRHLEHLLFACPYYPAWRRQLSETIQQVQGEIPGPFAGCYIDLVLATRPHVCSSAAHGHEPGSRRSWTAGIRALLSACPSPIMAEGCAETCIDLIDYPMMHAFFDSPDTVPLWKHVYGDLIPGVGGRMPASLNDTEMRELMQYVERLGLTAAGSPWLTSRKGQRSLEPKFARAARRASRRHPH